jgi:hypothetical protein
VRVTLRETWARLRRLDERIVDSPIGWLLPGGASYKVGRRHPGSSDRSWPYWFGVLLQGPVRGALSGWNYNAGRERGYLDRARPECAALIARFPHRLPPEDLADIEQTLRGREPEQAVRALAVALVKHRVTITEDEFAAIKAATEGRLTYGRMPDELATLVRG